MNLRISKAAAVLFISSFFFASCEDPTAIGLELQEPGTQIGTSYTDTATVKASTVSLKDSILGLGAARVQVGRINEGVFGTVTAKTYAEFAPLSYPANADSIDVSRGADSLVINLDYNYAFGDTTKAIQMNVHRLTQAFRDDETYYTYEALTYNDTPVGSITFSPQPNTTYRSTTDTTQRVPALIRIKATGSFANEVLQALSQSSNTQAFANIINGLAFVPANGSDEQGSIIGFLPTSTNTSITLHYKSKKNIAKSTTMLFTDRYYNHVTADRTGTPFASLTTNGSSISSSNTGNRTYLQAGAGLVTKIELPYIAQLRKTASGGEKNLAINKAELIIPVLESTVLSKKDFSLLPPVITVVEATPSNRIALNPGGIPNALMAEGSTAPATLQYRGAKGGYVYVVNITSYMQNLLYNVRANNGLILLPSNVSSTASTPTNFAQTVNRVILEANQSPSADRRIKLRLFYSTAQ
ncbi:DUF4270 family protein [Rufibacter sediminis]|uniref:DUF4270 domain-containing protein n=1 Tax=Rufibacter sediminis TaxID=2762756 RepID=A0ABR6VQS9_9BACT|nr:DUF4270 family protein [Rufibacter sediminis]MBC3539554.1 DUF4270 domain-containing protein [Rufibacter sediminis]